ncbi:MAG: glycosyltransferase family 39 protein [Flavobacteriales bacterium]|nr:glycosyltransferase family 39 protein [Flavobacteriales bacterium]
MISHFSNEQLALLLPGLALVMVSLWLHLNEKYQASVILLCLGALYLYLFSSILDPFLNSWDERFHALVAKHMMADLFHPTLYQEKLLDLSYDRWDRDHTWLHKPPLFMWQMAISFKIFGCHLFALRLPGALLATLTIPAIYRSGLKMVNRHTGYYAALIATASFYLIELVSGRQGTDHNDLVFYAYVTLSLCAWIEYVAADEKRKVRWMILTGILSACAVLTKWLPGLLVFIPWGIYAIRQHQSRLKEYRHLIGGILIAVVIPLLWQAYIFRTFPDVAHREWVENGKHFSIAYEGHGGPWYFHFTNFPMLYGWIATILIIPSLILLYRRIPNPAYRLPVFATLAAAYLFYSLAATKMNSYPLVCGLIIFLALGTFLAEMEKRLAGKPAIRKALLFIGAGGFFFYQMNLSEIAERHTTWKDNPTLETLTQNRKVYQELQNELPENSVLFNIMNTRYAELMFFTDITGYNFMPEIDQIDALVNQGKNVYLLLEPEAEQPPIVSTAQGKLKVIRKHLDGYF